MKYQMTKVISAKNDKYHTWGMSANAMKCLWNEVAGQNYQRNLVIDYLLF